VKSRNTSPHFTPAEVPNTPLTLLAKVRTVGGLANIVYAINQSRDPASEPFVRFRTLDAWDRDACGCPYRVGVYDLGKDVDDHTLNCKTITEARSFVLGILTARRFRKHNFRA
jgi:hypothetical protein